MSRLQTEQKNQITFYLLRFLPIIVLLLVFKPCHNLFDWQIKGGTFNVSQKADQAAQLYSTVYIPNGTFAIGRDDSHPDEAPRHQVTLTKGFHIMKTEVTRELYSLVLEVEITTTDGCNGDCPMNRISWEEATFFADALSKLEKREECYSTGSTACSGWRLPTEAEWEYAAGAKEKHRFSGSNFREEIGWYNYNSEEELHEVCTKQPNKFDLCDMSGNLWEWTQDWYGSYPSTPQENPMGPAEGNKKVIRGGSWTGPYVDMMITNRNALDPDIKNRGLGFRLVRTSE